MKPHEQPDGLGDDTVTHPDDLDPHDAHALDPDLADVPPELLAIAADPLDPEGATPLVSVVVAPGLWGHVRRLREQGDGAA